MQKRSQRGFTLLELIFVVVLLGLLSSLALPRVSNVLGMNLRSGATRVSGYLRSAYEQAVMRHQRLRVRFDLTHQTYWTEVYEEAHQSVPLLDANTKMDEAMDAFRELREKPLPTEEEVLLERQQRYEKIEDGSLKPKKLPQRVRFKGVYLPSEEQIVTSGAPWVEFTPSGFSSQVIIYVTNTRDEIYSIILQPLGGRSRVEKGEVRPDEI